MTAPLRSSGPPAPVRPLGLTVRPSNAASPAPEHLLSAGRRLLAAVKLLVLALALAAGLAGAVGGAVAGLWWAAQSAGTR